MALMVSAVAAELSTTMTSTVRPAIEHGNDSRQGPISARDLYATMMIESSGDSDMDTAASCAMPFPNATSARCASAYGSADAAGFRTQSKLWPTGHAEYTEKAGSKRTFRA